MDEVKEQTMPAAPRSLWADAWRRLRKSRLAVFCLWIIVVFTAMSLYGFLVYWRYNVLEAKTPLLLRPLAAVAAKVLRAEAVKDLQPPYQRQRLAIQYSPPGWAAYKGEDGRERREFFLMGTDGLGRDVFQRVVQGTRIAFQVGIVTSLIAIPIGVFLGCLAGYFGGKTDDLIVWLFSTVAAMPGLLFILAIAMVVGKGLTGVYLGIGLTMWVSLCRLIRGEVMKHKEMTYVRAARTLGLSHPRIIFGHILPNVFHLVIITFSMSFPAAVGTEVFMSFLGIGVQGEPSWGIMISEARLRLWYGVWWEMAFTTLAILIIVLAFNLLGDALRDALDPRLREQADEVS